MLQAWINILPQATINLNHCLGNGRKSFCVLSARILAVVFEAVLDGMSFWQQFADLGIRTSQGTCVFVARLLPVAGQNEYFDPGWTLLPIHWGRPKQRGSVWLGELPSPHPLLQLNDMSTVDTQTKKMTRAKRNLWTGTWYRRLI